MSNSNNTDKIILCYCLQALVEIRTPCLLSYTDGIGERWKGNLLKFLPRGQRADPQMSWKKTLVLLTAVLVTSPIDLVASDMNCSNRQFPWYVSKNSSKHSAFDRRMELCSMEMLSLSTNTQRGLFRAG